ncbi:tetratricopeptide repeat protein [Neomegalonema sp.]|uniref:tetratricopeptide repeat protein n=1 Tax=Neomegalonema sp. TaxID=2039713 RepID=UPI00260DD66D|nr:tetratricopeptide repeat protein [Neomegalonema sp.]MDD2869829.1 tetratricopeptide repeat protein [Neomegalonema sp.]
MTQTSDLSGFTLAGHQRRLREAERLMAAEAEKGGRKESLLARRAATLARERLALGEESFLEARRARDSSLRMLERLHNQFDVEDLKVAREGLEQGEGDAAEVLFAELEERQLPAISRAAWAAHQQGLLAWESLRLADARAHMDRALRLEPDNWSLLRDGAEILAACGDEAGARRMRARALKAAEAGFGRDSAEAAEAAGRLAASEHARGDWAEAERNYRRALALDEELLGPEAPDVAARLAALAGLLRDQGRIAEAEAALTRALQIGRGALGEEHPEFGALLGALGGLRRAQGRLDEAAELLAEAIRVARASVGGRHPTLALRLNNLAGLRRAQGFFAEAETLYKEAVKIDLDALGPHHPGTAIDMANLAGLYEEMGVDMEAEDLFSAAEAVFREVHGPAHGLTRLAAEGRLRAARRLALEGISPARSSDTAPHGGRSSVPRGEIA